MIKRKRVYLIMCCGWQPEISTKKYPVKIGISDDVHSRILQLQTGNPYPLTYLAESRCNGSEITNLEKALHEKFTHQILRGEWFGLTKLQIVWVRERIFRHKNISDAVKEVFYPARYAPN